MKKLFALLMVAGTLAMYSCGGGEHKEAAADSTAAESTVMEPAADSSAAAPVDSAAAAPADSAAAAPAAH
jgi:hypothetical protein